jgi:hypothetical protein
MFKVLLESDIGLKIVIFLGKIVVGTCGIFDALPAKIERRGGVQFLMMSF